MERLLKGEGQNPASSLQRILFCGFFHAATCLFYGLALPLPAQANESKISELGIKPGFIQSFPDNSFELSVKVSNVTNLFAVAFDLVYDEERISLESITEGSFLNEGGDASTIFLWDDQPGRVIVAITRLNSNDPGVSTTEDTTLVKLNFMAETAGWSNLHLENFGLMDPQLNAIPCETLEATVQIPGPPVISEIPDTAFSNGDTLRLHLNDYVTDPDTPLDELTWEILELPFLDYQILSGHVVEIWSSGFLGETYATLRVVDPEDLSDEATFGIAVSTSVSVDYISPVSGQPDVWVYPNPFTDRITICIYNPFVKAQELSIELFNQQGQLVKHHSDEIITENETSVTHLKLTIYPVKSLPAGIYVLVVYIGEHSFTRKLIR